MAKQLIPEELNELIQEYLTDGVLTDKERQVILKKAEGLGLDRDEIDLYLDAEVQKIDQATDAAARRQKGKQCPYCGGSVPQLTDKCPHCGVNITAEASEELQEIFDNLEEALVNLKSGKDIHTSKATVERYARKAKMYFGNNPKVQKLLEEIEVETASAAKQAKSIVRNRTISDLLKRYGWILLVLILVGIGLWYFMRPDPTSDPKACIDAAMEAVQKGNLEEAEAICAGFTQGSSYSAKEIKDAYTAICKAYVEKGDYDRAIRLIDGNIELNDLLQSVRKEISEKCLKAGNYDDADKYMDFAYHREQSEYYDFLCKCIDHMKENGKTSDIISFIDRKAEKMEMDPNHPELTKQWDPQLVKQKLIKYAGLDVNE